ncbi:MAG TPA: hypothetical protein VGE21_13260 [Flavobacteriales bacterium]
MKALSFALFLLPITVKGTDLQVVLDGMGQPTCSNNNGVIGVLVQGGIWPVTLLWQDGNTSSYRTGLAPGTYTVTATDAEGNTAMATYELEAIPTLYFLEMRYNIDGFQESFPCPGEDNGRAVLPLMPGPEGIYMSAHGTAPFTYTMQMDGDPILPDGFDGFGNPWYGGIRRGAVLAYTYTDATGCANAWSTIAEGPFDTVATVLATTPACSGADNGSITVDPPNWGGPWGGGLSIYDADMNGVVNYSFDYEVFTIGDLAPGEYSMVVTYGNPECPAYVQDPITVGELPTECGTVEGTLYIDSDQNCVQDPGEPGIPGRIVEILPGPIQAITDADGHYTRSLENGSYTLQVLGDDLWPLCPATMPVPFTVITDVTVIDLADSSTVQLDLRAEACGGTARPGFEQGVWFSVENLTAQVSGALQVTLTFDAQLSFIAATPAPTSQSGNVVVWDMAALGAYANTGMYVQLQVPADPGLLGQMWTHSVSATQPLAESNPTNNTTTAQGIFTGSYDPNDKQVQTSSRSNADLYLVEVDEYLDYTIRFQNSGTDTAFTVVITDTLDLDLDLSTFEPLMASHPHTITFRTGRVVEWRFADILLPDSNTNEALSHGMIRFRIRPVQPVLLGTEYRNNADIFFDFNPPVRTNDAVLVVGTTASVAEAGKERLLVFPSPATNTITLRARPEQLTGELRITALDGRTVLRQRASSTVNVEGLVPGIYQLDLLTRNGELHQARFVKQ